MTDIKVSYDTDAPRRAGEYAAIIGANESSLFCIIATAQAAAKYITTVEGMRLVLNEIASMAQNARDGSQLKFNETINEPPF